MAGAAALNLPRKLPGSQALPQGLHSGLGWGSAVARFPGSSAAGLFGKCRFRVAKQSEVNTLEGQDLTLLSSGRNCTDYGGS